MLFLAITAGLPAHYGVRVKTGGEMFRGIGFWSVSGYPLYTFISCDEYSIYQPIMADHYMKGGEVSNEAMAFDYLGHCDGDRWLS